MIKYITNMKNAKKPYIYSNNKCTVFYFPYYNMRRLYTSKIAPCG